MVTITYLYYTDTYKGFTVPSAKFDFYIEKAIDYFYENTPNATDEEREDVDTLDSVKKACCEIADDLYKQDNNKNNISSQKSGSYAVSYDTSAVSESLGSSIYSILTRRLGRTGLLDRGVSC